MIKTQNECKAGLNQVLLTLGNYATCIMFVGCCSSTIRMSNFDPDQMPNNSTSHPEFKPFDNITMVTISLSLVSIQNDVTSALTSGS